MVTVKSMEFASFTLGLLGIIASLLVLGGPRPGPDVLPGIPSAQTCLQWQWLFNPGKKTIYNCLQWGPPSAMTCIGWVWSADPTRLGRAQEDFSLAMNCEKWAPPSDMTCLKWWLNPAFEDYLAFFMSCTQWPSLSSRGKLQPLSSDGRFSDAVDEALGFRDMVLLTSAIHVLANLSLLYGVYKSNSCFMVIFFLYYILTTVLGFIFALLLASYESTLVAMCLFPMECSAILLYGNSLFLPVFISVMKSVLFFCTIILLLEMNGIKKNAKPASENKMQVDSVFVVNLPSSPKPQEIFPNALPSELFEFIFSHSNMATLRQLSATSRVLRLEVHNFFTSRLSDQAKKYPEVKDSLARLGWTNKHDHSTCDCFKLLSGPGFTCRQLSERKFLSTVSEDDVAYTTVAGKTFVLTSDKEVVFFETSTENNMMPQNPRSLVSFKSSPIEIGSLSSCWSETGYSDTSYDEVLAFSMKKPAPNPRFAICIYNPTTLSKITEIDLIADNNLPEDIHNVEVGFIDFAKDTMAISLKGSLKGNARDSILMWKINTKDPKEEGTAFRGTIDAGPPMHNLLEYHFGTILRLNYRFVAILHDDRVEVVDRRNGVVRPISRGGAWGMAGCAWGNKRDMAGWALEKEKGDHMALALSFALAHPKLVFQIHSVTQGHIIIQKEVVGWPFPSVKYMEWFGPHLVVILEKNFVLSMLSWQPGRTSFLACPLDVPVVRRSARVGGGGGAEPEWVPGGDREPKWVADCVHVDFGGITVTLKNRMWDSKKHVWRYE